MGSGSGHRLRLLPISYSQLPTPLGSDPQGLTRVRPLAPDVAFHFDLGGEGSDPVSRHQSAPALPSPFLASAVRSSLSPGSGMA